MGAQQCTHILNIELARMLLYSLVKAYIVFLVYINLFSLTTIRLSLLTITIAAFTCVNVKYRNDPKFSDRQVYANSVDPDQTAPTLTAIPSASL